MKIVNAGPGMAITEHDMAKAKYKMLSAEKSNKPKRKRQRKWMP